MNFLNTALLGGSAAMLAPLLIHLLNRSRYRTLDWGAMHLLEAALQSNSRRLQWEQWLLLLIRCLIPILLALALARPVLTSFQLASVSGNRSLLLLLDDSLSMTAINGGVSLLEQGRVELSNIVATAAPAEFALWTTSSPPQDRLGGSSLQTSQVQAALQKVESTAGSSTPDTTLLSGLRQLQAMSGSYKQLIVASDFQASQWRAVSDAQLHGIREQLQSSSITTQLALLPIVSTMSPNNVSVHSLEKPSVTDHFQTRLETPFRWTTRIVNHGDQPVSDLRLTFEVDGRELAVRTVSLAPRASEQIEFACEFTQLGWHRLALNAADPSSVHGDDHCYAVVEVARQPIITIIDDSLTDEQIRTRQFIGTSRYLRLALAPLEHQEENSFAIQVLTSAQMNRSVMARSAAIVVSDVSQWSDDLRTELYEFVDDGGGLLVFEYQPNKSLEFGTQRAGWNEQSPNLFGYAVGELHRVDPGQSSHLETSSPGTLEWIAWNTANDSLHSLEFTRWVKLAPNPQATTARDLLSLTNGDPWLVEQVVGEGIVLQCAGSCSDDGTNMPRQPGYVPLMLSLAEKITQHGLLRAHAISGESIALHLVPSENQSTDSHSAQANQTPTIDFVEVKRIAPTAEDSTNSMESISNWPLQDGRAIFTATREPGVYSAHAKSGTVSASQSAVSTASPFSIDPPLFTVAIDPSESQLGVLTESELNRLAEHLGATIIGSSREFTDIQNVQRDGWEIWRWVVLAVLALLLIELLLGLRSSAGSVRGAL